MRRPSPRIWVARVRRREQPSSWLSASLRPRASPSSPCAPAKPKRATEPSSAGAQSTTSHSLTVAGAQYSASSSRVRSPCSCCSRLESATRRGRGSRAFMRSPTVVSIGIRDIRLIRTVADSLQQAVLFLPPDSADKSIGPVRPPVTPLASIRRAQAFEHREVLDVAGREAGVDRFCGGGDREVGHPDAGMAATPFAEFARATSSTTSARPGGRAEALRRPRPRPSAAWLSRRRFPPPTA